MWFINIIKMEIFSSSVGRFFFFWIVFTSMYLTNVRERWEEWERTWNWKIQNNFIQESLILMTMLNTLILFYSQVYTFFLFTFLFIFLKLEGEDNGEDKNIETQITFECLSYLFLCQIVVWSLVVSFYF